MKTGIGLVLAAASLAAFAPAQEIVIKKKKVAEQAAAEAKMQADQAEAKAKHAAKVLDAKLEEIARLLASKDEAVKGQRKHAEKQLQALVETLKKQGGGGHLMVISDDDAEHGLFTVGEDGLPKSRLLGKAVKVKGQKAGEPIVLQFGNHGGDEVELRGAQIEVGSGEAAECCEAEECEECEECESCEGAECEVFEVTEGEPISVMIEGDIEVVGPDGEHAQMKFAPQHGDKVEVEKLGRLLRDAMGRATGHGGHQALRYSVTERIDNDDDDDRNDDDDANRNEGRAMRWRARSVRAGQHAAPVPPPPPPAPRGRRAMVMREPMPATPPITFRAMRRGSRAMGGDANSELRDAIEEMREEMRELRELMEEVRDHCRECCGDHDDDDDDDGATKTDCCAPAKKVASTSAVSVPVLRDVPLVGTLFRADARSVPAAPAAPVQARTVTSASGRLSAIAPSNAPSKPIRGPSGFGFRVYGSRSSQAVSAPAETVEVRAVELAPTRKD